MEHKRCYRYEPDQPTIAKRRRIEAPRGLHKTWSVRRTEFETRWSQLERRIDDSLGSASSTAVEQVRETLSRSRPSTEQQKLPACLMSIEPGSRARDVVTALVTHGRSGERHVVLSAADAPDLKTALKKIVKGCSVGAYPDDDDEPEEPYDPRRGPRKLAYDLQRVVDDCAGSQYLIIISDAEAFRPDILSELIEYLALWLDRIPFALLICCAVPADMLQQSLSQRALRKLDCCITYAASCHDEIETVLDCMMEYPGCAVFLGSHLLRWMLQRQHDYLSDVSTFIASLKYASMCAYYANPLVSYLIPDADLDEELYEALRTTGSFRQLVVNSTSADAMELLNHTSMLRQKVGIELGKSIAKLRSMYHTVKFLVSAWRLILPDRESHVTTQWLQCLSGTLAGSTALRQLYLGVRKASLPVLVQTAGLLRKHMSEDEGAEDEIRQQVQEGLENIEAEDDPIKLGARLAPLLEDFCAQTLQAPKELLFHEIFLYDSTSPSREVLAPRPRQAVERALSAPHDYLDCECCAPVREEAEGVGSLSHTQPVTAVLYQLYLESGNIINVHDAWQAFSAILGDETSEEMRMALFQRSLAELRHLGMVKSTRRRIDHIAKMAWKGL